MITKAPLLPQGSAGGDSNSDHRDPEARELVLSRRRQAEVPPGSTRLASLLALLCLALPACAGEALVEYRGAVVARQVPDHTFSAAPNPEGLPPVPGAEVALIVCSDRCGGGEPARRTVADSAGLWGPLDLVFGGGLADHEIVIEVTAPGYAPYRYSTIFESTRDPTSGDRYMTIGLAAE